MLNHGTLTPAYGRDYASADLAIADLNAGKDFVFQDPWNQGYIGKSDLANGADFRIRYSNLRKVVACRMVDGVARKVTR